MTADQPVSGETRLIRPRWNKDAENRRDLIQSLLTEAFKDPEILDAWNATLLAFERATSSPTDDNSSRLRDKGDVLDDLLTERVPTLGYMFGPYFARFFLDFMGIQLPEWLPLKIQQLRPDNPLAIAPGGAVLHTENATIRDYQQLRDYYRSFEPEGNPGRPPEHLVLAKRAYQLHLDGKKPFDICRELFPDADLYDRKTRNKIRMRVSRLSDRGRLEQDREKLST